MPVDPLLKVSPALARGGKTPVKGGSRTKKPVDSPHTAGCFARAGEKGEKTTTEED